MWIKNFVLLLLMDACFMEITCQETEEESSTSDLRELSNNLVESTFLAEKTSKNLTQELVVDHQVRVLQKMTDYRLQRIMHGERSFEDNGNVQWRDCVSYRKRSIEEFAQQYTEEEGSCSKIALADVREKNRGVKQILKQITEWRRGYKYLIRQCKENYPRNKTSAEDCLDTYVQKDHYDDTLSKLLTLLKDSHNDFKNTTEDSLNNLDTCLEDALSRYLEEVRLLKNELDICYEMKVKTNPVAEALKKLRCVS